MKKLDLQPVHPGWSGPVPDFDREYARIVGFTYDLRESTPRPQMYGKPIAPRQCAICKRSEPAVTFSSQAHLIAACLGNRSIFSHEDCDACNGDSGREYENDLGQMLMAQRVIGRVRAREGTPKVRLSNGAIIGGGSFDEPIKVVQDRTSDLAPFKIQDDKSATLDIPIQSYRPMRGLCSLLRSIWLGMSPEARAEHVWLLDIIRGTRAIPKPEYFEFFVSGGVFEDVLLEAWQPNSGCSLTTAHLVCRLVFVNTLVLWAAPDPVSLEHRPSLLPSIGALQPMASRFIQLQEPDAKQDARTVTYTLQYGSEVDLGSSGKMPKQSSRRRTAAANAEFESAELKVSVLNVPLIKHNIYSKKPYFEIKGGGLTGWLAIQIVGDGKVNMRFEYAPHTGSPGEARATWTLLTALATPGTLWIRNAKTGDPMIRLDTTRIPSPVPILDINSFLEDLELLNRSLGLDLRVPPPPAKLPQREVAVLAAGIKYGRVSEPMKDPITVPLLTSMAREFISGAGKSLAGSSELPIEILGSYVDAGRHTLVLYLPEIKERERVLADLEGKNDGDIIEVEFKCAKLIHEFERWMPVTSPTSCAEKSGT